MTNANLKQFTGHKNQNEKLTGTHTMYLIKQRISRHMPYDIVVESLIVNYITHFNWELVSESAVEILNYGSFMK